MNSKTKHDEAKVLAMNTDANTKLTEPLLAEYNSSEDEEKHLSVINDDELRASLVKQESGMSSVSSPRREYFMELLKRSTAKLHSKKSFYNMTQSPKPRTALYNKRGGSDKAASSDSDNDQLNLFQNSSYFPASKNYSYVESNRPILQFSNKIVTTDLEHHLTTFDIDQTTPTKIKKGFQSFSKAEYHSVLKEEVDEEFNMNLARNNAKSMVIEMEKVRPELTVEKRGFYKKELRSTLAVVPESDVNFINELE
jgi:hypothetical protein